MRRHLVVALLLVAGIVAGQDARYEIDRAATEARFAIDEVLFGSPTRVVGTTSLVEGSLVVGDQPGQWLRFERFRVDARSLVTDNNARNRAIERRILMAHRDEFRYVVFAPGDVRGAPRQPVSGNVEVTVSGDLTIRDVTRPVSFTVRLDLGQAGRIAGSAAATITREEFGLRIPWVPFVADVGQEVLLELDFVARSGG